MQMCAQNASLSRQEESLASGSTKKIAALMDAAKTMLRSFGSRGGATCQGILVAGDIYQEACAAYRQATKQGPGQKKKGAGRQKRAGIKQGERAKR